MGSRYGVGEAKSRFSELVRKAEQGEEIIVSRSGRDVVRLIPARRDERPRRAPGSMRGRLSVPEDFDRWPDDVAKALGVID